MSTRHNIDYWGRYSTIKNCLSLRNEKFLRPDYQWTRFTFYLPSNCWSKLLPLHKNWCDNKGIHLHSQFPHNLLTMWVTMWEEFRSHCDSQYQMTSEFFSQSIHILLNIFWERRNSSARKIVPWKKHRKNVNFGPILKKFIFLIWE